MTKPQIGMGATINYVSDKVPATIVEIRSNCIILQEDKYTRTDNNGFSEVQEYTYAPNLEGLLYTATLRKDRVYRLKGSPNIYITLGKRRRYFDYSF